MAEWFKAAVLKTAVGESLPWVRIPPLPPATAVKPSNALLESGKAFWFPRHLRLNSEPSGLSLALNQASDGRVFCCGLTTLDYFILNDDRIFSRLNFYFVPLAGRLAGPKIVSWALRCPIQIQRTESPCSPEASAECWRHALCWGGRHGFCSGCPTAPPDASRSIETRCLKPILTPPQAEARRPGGPDTNQKTHRRRQQE